MFLPYDKIGERWQGEGGDERLLARETWIVTEKIHGANFAVVGDSGARLRFAKRRELLAPGESFFGHEVLVARLLGEFERAVELGRKIFGDTTSIVLYGELFGGHYPHAGVTPCAGLKPVQTGVWYSPNLEFCAFDLAAVHSDGRRELLAYDRALEVFGEAGLLAAEPLLVGSFAEATRFPIERPSTIPARLGLPPLDEANLAEGVVAKTLGPVRLHDGTWVRPAFKRKISAFAEDERYQGAEKPAGSPRQSGDALGLLLDRVLALMNRCRAAAAISKVGELDSESRRSQAAALVRDDLLDELAAREPAAMAALTPSDRAILSAQLDLLAAALFDGR